MADLFQALIIKNRASDQVGTLSRTLAAIYDAFTKIVDESDGRIPRVDTTGRTLFAIKDYASATEHYRWVVDHGDWSDTRGSTSGSRVSRGQSSARGRKHKEKIEDRKHYRHVIDASIKAIAARYEVLREKKMIPAELKPVPERKSNDKTLEPYFGRMGRLDRHSSQA